MCNEIPYPVMEYKQLHSNMQRCGIDKPRIPDIQLKHLQSVLREEGDNVKRLTDGQTN